MNLKIFELLSSPFGRVEKWLGQTKKVKVALSGLRYFLAAENPLKIMKNAFYFTSNVLFVLKIFKFLS